MFEFYAYPGWRSIHGGPQDDSSPGGYTANRIGKKTGGEHSDIVDPYRNLYYIGAFALVRHSVQTKRVSVQTG